MPADPIRHRTRSLGSTGQIRKTAAYYLSFLALGMTTATVGPTLPYLADQTHSLLSGISFLFTTRAVGYLFFSLLAGRLFDRVTGHPVMAAALCVMALTMAAVPLSPLLWLVVLIFLVLGMAEATVDIGGNTLLVWVHRHRVGPFMNGLHLFFGIGAFLTPIMVAQVVLASNGIDWAYRILALLALPVAAWLLRLPSPKSPIVDSDESLRPCDRASTGAKRGILVALFALFLLLNVGAEIGFGGWVFSYAVVTGLASAASAAYLTSAFWGALTLGRLLAIPLSARVRPSFLLMADLAGCLVSLGIIVLWRDSAEALWVGAFGMGLSMASIIPVTMSLAERRMTITGLTTGWFFAGSSVGIMTLPWLMGQLFESISPFAAIIAVGIAILAATGVLVALLSYSGRSAAGLDGGSGAQRRAKGDAS
jgi:FHS family Na+ dependent glucose MFS transporter 1